MSAVKSDIEIARAAKMKPIQEILDGINVPDKAEVYSPIGRYIAKIKPEYLNTLKDKKDGKLILVTAITPTPAGEGKTTTSVGLCDGLNKIGKRTFSEKSAIGMIFFTSSLFNKTASIPFNLIEFPLLE